MKEIKNNVSEETTNEIQETVQEIDYELVSSGPLYLDPRHKKPGYVYKFVADRPGDIDAEKRYGYVVVTDDLNVGDNIASKTTRFGSAVTVQSKCGALLVLMAITEEGHKKLMAFRDGKNKEREKALGKIAGIPDKYQEFNGQSLSEYKTTNK